MGQQFEQYPARGFRFAKKVSSAPFTVLGIQNLRTCGDPMGLIVAKSLPTSEEIAPARRRGMGSPSHWQFPDHKYIHPLSTARTKGWASDALSCNSAGLRCLAATPINTVCIPSVHLVQFTAN